MKTRWPLLPLLLLSCAAPEEGTLPDTGAARDEGVEAPRDAAPVEDAGDAAPTLDVPRLADVPPLDASPPPVICVPTCGERVCGSDGCGGNCGACPEGQMCVDGACACAPTCEGRSCGPDGCGGVCGACMEGLACEGGACACPGGQCACIPDCGGARCGPDGCGGSCGQCAPGMACDEAAGACVCAPTCEGRACGDDGCGGSCGACPAGSACVLWACECAPDCGGRACGDDGCGGACGACPAGQACVAGACQPDCAPDCAGLQCGDDGCGGSCGQCAAGASCVEGHCQLDCAPDCAGRQCGDDGCGESCGECAVGASCVAGWCQLDCAPNCVGRQCGADGCGGSCGACSGEEVCQEGICAPPWIVDGEARCPELAPLRDAPEDASAALQACVDRTPEGLRLALEPGRYMIAEQVLIRGAIRLGTLGREWGAACGPDEGHGCAELRADRGLDARLGVLVVRAAAEIDHVVVHGNRQQREGTHAHQMCATLSDNTYGFNLTLECSGCAVRQSASIYALCGTGMVVIPPAAGVSVTDSTFAYNGVHTTQNMWADGLTVLESSNGVFSNNTFIDNTDIDLIFGGCLGCRIQGNTIRHTEAPDGGAFAALMIQKWATTSGNYADVEVTGNSIDCGPLRACGSGLYIGSEGWYPGTPYGTLEEGRVSGRIMHNSVRSAMNALYIAAQGLEIHSNDFFEAHGVEIPNSCGRRLVSRTPIIVSPTTLSCHFGGENVDPEMSVHYSSESWAGCIPNYPF